jgi:Chaperone of endosialidase
MYKKCGSFGECRLLLDLSRDFEPNPYSFRYQTEYAQYSGLKDGLDTGVIAQEIQKILPDAIKGSETLVLPNGIVIDNFLLVNKVSLLFLIDII